LVVSNSRRIISAGKVLFSNSASRIAMIYAVPNQDESHEIAELKIKFTWIRLLIIRSPLSCIRVIVRGYPFNREKWSIYHLFQSTTKSMWLTRRWHDSVPRNNFVAGPKLLEPDKDRPARYDAQVSGSTSFGIRNCNKSFASSEITLAEWWTTTNLIHGS
jgi:hypothetical protein